MNTTETFYKDKIHALETQVRNVREVVEHWAGCGLPNIPTVAILDALDRPLDQP